MRLPSGEIVDVGRLSRIYGNTTATYKFYWFVSIIDLICANQERRRFSFEEIIASSALSLAFFDGFPVSPGYALIIPRRHVASFFELTKEEKQDLLSLMDNVKCIIDEKYHPDGYNIGVNVGEAAGQSVLHVHMHLIPRYKGDVPNPRGGVRGVIPSKQNY